METTSWSLPAAFEVVAAAAPDRDMLVWKQTRRTYGEVERRTRRPRRVPPAARHRPPPRAPRARALGVRAGDGRPAPLQLPRVHRVDARLLPRPRRALQRQPALPARGGAEPARHARRRGRRLPSRARAPRRRGGAGTPAAFSSTSTTARSVARSRAARASRTPSRAPADAADLPAPSPDDLYLVCTGGTTGRPRPCSGARATSSSPRWAAATTRSRRA